MRRLALVALCSAFVATPFAFAQNEAPAAAPVTVSKQPEKAKPLYDEKADAREQIAAALAKAKKENRRVLIQWGGNWCGWCIKLHETCQKDAKVRAKLQYEYDVVHIDAGRDDKNMDLAKSYGADIDGFPYLTILDSSGKAIVNQNSPPFEVDGKSLAAGHDPAKLLEFFTKHQAPYPNAQELLDNAMSEAKKSGKKVFLHFGAPSCVWCHRMEAWMAKPEIAALLAKDFVDLKIDVDRTDGGKELKKKFMNGKEGGIPWFLFLDETGKTVATSDGAEGNVGFPYQPAEVAHFAAMLEKASSKLTKSDIETLVASLNANREAEEKKKAQK